jgi:peptide/nickel transport system substrate-binding protein
MRYNPETQEFEPRIAESVTTDDNIVWTLKIKPGVKFSDGTDYNAEAVVFGMKRHAQYGSRAAALVRQITEYTVVDDLTVRFTLGAPYSNFPYILAFTPGMIPSPTAVKTACKIGQPDEIKVARECPFNTAPVGAGPYKIDSFKPAESITLVRNESYWDGRPHLDSIKFVTITQASLVLENLKADTVQSGYMREAEPGKKAEDDPDLDTYLNLVWAGNGLVLNNGEVMCRGGIPAAMCANHPDGLIELDTPTKDRRVRQAIAAAIDPEIIDERVDNSTGYPGGVFFQEGSKWESSEPVNVYDPDRARELVEEVKAEGNWDGSVRLVCSAAQQRHEVVVATLLEAVGFTVNRTGGTETAQQINTITNLKQFDVGCWGFSMAEEAPEVIFSLAFNASSAGNSMNHQLTEIDEQSALLRAADNDEDRKAALEAIQDIWREENPSVITAATPERIVWRTNVHGLTPNVASTILWHDAWVD